MCSLIPLEMRFSLIFSVSMVIVSKWILYSLLVMLHILYSIHSVSVDYLTQFYSFRS